MWQILVLGTVSVINPYNNTVIKNITVGISPIFITSESGYIYVANAGSNTVSVINSTTNNVIKNITVGISPIFITSESGYIYVANTGSSTVSVINPYNNTVIKNITVGQRPYSVSSTSLNDYVYVTNSNSSTVSVINSTTNNVIKNITVGNGPSSIIPVERSIYVVNTGSNTVSVINSTTNNVKENITVGVKPIFITINSENKLRLTTEDYIYVVNTGSNTVSVIDPLTNEVVAGITFDVKPFRAGHIICNGLEEMPINRHILVSSGTKCIAKPNNGYEFASWIENLDGNSTRTINATTPSDWLGYPLTSLREAFTDDPAATLTVNRFGNFTAYFRALPPPVSAEFTASLITVIVAAFVGSLLIPAVVRLV